MRSRLHLPLLAVLAVVLVVVLAGLVTNNVTDGLDLAIIRAIRASALVAPLAILRQVTELGSTTAMMVLAIVLLLSELVARRPWSGITRSRHDRPRIARQRACQGPDRAGAPGPHPADRRGARLQLPVGARRAQHGRLRGRRAARGAKWRASRVKVAAAFAAGCLVALIGISRVYLGAHFPTDVLAGWLAGGAIVLIFAWLSPASKARAGAPAAWDPAGQRSDPPAKP